MTKKITALGESQQFSRTLQQCVMQSKHQSKQAIKALHSELLTELSSQVLSRNESGRVGTSSEKARKTRSYPNF